MEFIKSKFRNPDQVTASQINQIEDAVQQLEESRGQQGILVPADYSENGSILQDYIRNRPFWYFKDNGTYGWDGVTTPPFVTELFGDNLGWIDGSEAWQDFMIMHEQRAVIGAYGQTLECVAYVVNSKNIAEFEGKLMSGELTSGLLILDYGDIEMGMPNLIAMIFYVDIANGIMPMDLVVGQWLTQKAFDLEGVPSEEIKPGIFTYNLEASADGEYITLLSVTLDVEEVFVDSRYEQFFKNLHDKNYTFVVVNPEPGYDWEQHPKGTPLFVVGLEAPGMPI